MASTLEENLNGEAIRFIRKELPDRPRIVVVPLGKKEIPRGTLRSIMRQAGLTGNQLADLLK